MAEEAEEAGEAEAVEAAVVAVAVTDEVEVEATAEATVADEVPTSLAPTLLLSPTSDGRLAN